MDELTLHDLLAILHRRKKSFFITAALLFLVTILLVLNWSNYRSTAQIEIEQSAVSPNVLNAANNTLSDSPIIITDQSINKIQQKVTSPDSLSEIITKFNLYPNARKGTPLSALAYNMHNKIKLDFITPTVANPGAQKDSAEQLMSLSFNLSFDYSDARLAQEVTEELVARFLHEDLAQRQKYAKETSEFLATQIAALEKSMADQDKKIADFRAKHGDSGPAALMFNQQATVTTALSIQNIESQIASNEGTQGSLRSQLATVDPYSRVIADGQVLTTPAIQLKALEGQYATISGQYGPNHPDVIKLRSQIEALKSQMGHGGGGGGHHDNTAQLNAQINDVSTHLAAAKSTGGENNPDVKALQKKLQSLQQRLANSSSYSISDTIKRDADNPAYLELSSQLMAASEQHKSLVAQRDALVQQQAKYQKAVAENPDSEQQMATLSRDYDNAQIRYRELKEKKMQADMNEQLAVGEKGQRLLVINPPDLPRNTHPSRLMLLVAGLALSLMGGFAVIIISEALSESIHGPSQIVSLTGAAPLVIIPYILSEEEILRSIRLKPHKRVAAIAACLIVLVLLAIIVTPDGAMNNLFASSTVKSPQ